MDFKRSIQDCCKRESISQEMFCQRLGCTMSELRYAGNWSRIAHGAWVAFGAKLEGYEPRSSREERAWAEQLLPWIRRFPVKALQKRGLLPHGTCGAGSVRDVLRFMGVGGREGFDKTYAFTLDSVAPQVYAAWIRIGETLASADAAKSKSTFAVDKDLLARTKRALTKRGITQHAKREKITFAHGHSDTIRHADRRSKLIFQLFDPIRHSFDLCLFIL